jgi:uncharacterized protein YoxC
MSIAENEIRRLKRQLSLLEHEAEWLEKSAARLHQSINDINERLDPAAFATIDEMGEKFDTFEEAMTVGNMVVAVIGGDSEERQALISEAMGDNLVVMGAEELQRTFSEALRNGKDGQKAVEDELVMAGLLELSDIEKYKPNLNYRNSVAVRIVMKRAEAGKQTILSGDYKPINGALGQFVENSAWISMD